MTHIITHTAQHNLFGSSISSCRKCYITRRLSPFFYYITCFFLLTVIEQKTKYELKPDFDNTHQVASNICEGVISVLCLYTVRSVKLEWMSPGQPNGILGGYDVWRRTLQWCEELQSQQVFSSHTRCSYLECPAEKDFCGKTCYKPETQVTTQKPHLKCYA